jgi:hypothetical protein
MDFIENLIAIFKYRKRITITKWMKNQVICLLWKISPTYLN